MHIIRLNFRRISIWILALLQLTAIITYFYWQPKEVAPLSESKVSFLNTEEREENVQSTYHRINSNIILKSISTKHSYVDFNSSLCFINGTDLASMKLLKGINWKCNCLPGWHGNDCGQPEVLWRAMLTNRKPMKIKGPRTFQRRLIYIFKFEKNSEHVGDIRINELGNIVDLFILYEEHSNYLRHKLDNKFYKEYQSKILYVKESSENVWKKVKPYLKNLRNDDIILTSHIYEIPNRDALMFLKFYDQWPQPVKFRLRWSVFGFYWIHPSRTITSGGACTTSFLKESFDNKLKLLTDNKTLSSPAYKGLTLGDLNHYGGWFCEYCNDPAQIVEILATSKNVIIGNRNNNKIDANYIEELVENGVYIDGKTQLIKSRKYQDNYFAPKYVNDHEWKYDFLLINLYSKLDYYEG